MCRYIAWRLALVGPTVVIASIAIFVVMRVLPGDVTMIIAGDVAVSSPVREELRNELGLNESPPVQYTRWLWSVLSGEFGGQSLESRESIRSIISRQLPVTLLIVGYTTLLSVVIAVPCGVLAAVWENRWPDYIIRVVTLGGVAFPNLLVALIVMLGFLVIFGWTPPIVYTPPWVDPWLHAQIVALPVLILAWEYSSHLVRVTRTSMLEVLTQAYITTARSKGLPERIVIFRHGLSNALVPAITMVGLQFGILLSGTLILETIFGLPGVGRGLVHAAQVRDYPVIQTLGCLLVLVSLMANLAVDIAYFFFDPRIAHPA